VPVVVHGRAAWAEGVGEKLTPLLPPRALSEANYLIIKPNVSVATAAVFQDPELTRNSPPITIDGFLASGGRNDCMGVVRRRYPAVAQALDWLGQFGGARLTGTGACVFAEVETRQRGVDIVRKLPAAFEAFLVRGLNDSPLLARVADF
jgi:4-diphosphocytidyl-2-C-methyl-D-erythritol kinase